ncbi:MAG: stage 0 sporulation family protein [Negativicutes bacterium]|nr:stage 0 sporulation family protein [Negativicutes bacterium]
MRRVIGIKFKKGGKIYFFDPLNIALSVNDGVIVETARGLEFGYVATEIRTVDASRLNHTLKPVLRQATANDHRKLRENREREAQAFAICRKKIATHGLPMKLLNVEFTFDVSKIIFSFTAENRVDFRELVKDLASVFRTRIELRQVGVRDEARTLGGIGCCGRELCCATFLSDFVPVSIKMAKDQNLSLNPAKISGICGRLMCCLKFESEGYSKGCGDGNGRQEQ